MDHKFKIKDKFGRSHFGLVPALLICLRYGCEPFGDVGWNHVVGSDLGLIVQRTQGEQGRLHSGHVLIIKDFFLEAWGLHPSEPGPVVPIEQVRYELRVVKPSQLCKGVDLKPVGNPKVIPGLLLHEVFLGDLGVQLAQVCL